MAKFCKQCGRPLRENAKFCPACGATVRQAQAVSAPVCANCGGALKTTSKFCPRCGQTVGAPVPFAPQVAQAQPKKRFKTRAILIPAVALVLVAAILITGFVTPGWFKGSSDELKALKTESASLSAENPAATLCGVTIDADTYNLRHGDLTAEITDYGTGTDEYGSGFHQYSIRLGEQSQFDAAATLTFPCDGDPDDYVITHQDHETGEWMPMIGFPDRTNGTITVYTDSFSDFRATLKVDSPLFVVKDAGTPYATIEVSSNYLAVLEKMDKETYSKVTTAFAADPLKYEVSFDSTAPASTAMRDFLINAAGPLSEVIGDAAELNMTPVEFMINSKTYEYTGTAMKSDISTFMTGWSVAMIGLQLTKDVKQNGFRSSTTTANLMKNLATNSGTFYSMATGYSNPAFTMTFFGVALIGMELDAMVESAKNEQSAYMQKLMDTYYTKIKPFNEDWWYEEYNRICRDEFLTVQEGVQKIGNLLDQQAAEFWTVMERQSGKDYEDLLMEAGIKNIYNIPAEQKAEMTAAVKSRLRQQFNDQVLPKIEKDLIAKQQATIYAMLRDFAAPFNRKLHFRPFEHVDMNTTEQTRFNGCTLAFGLSDGKGLQTGDTWLLEVPESSEDEWNDGWELDLEATDYGWMCAAFPNTLYVYESRSAVGSEPLAVKSFDQPHATESRTARIDLSDSATYTWSLQKLEINPNYEPGGVEQVLEWSGDVNNLYVTWQESLDDGIVEYTDTNYSAGQTVDFPSDFEFICLYDETVEHYSDRSHSSSVSVAFDGATANVSQERYVAGGEIGHSYKDEQAFPRALEGRTFTVTVHRGIYYLVYSYLAVPVEDQGKYDAEIVNNCEGGGMEPFLGSWLMMNDDGTLVSSAKDIPLIITEKSITFPNWGVNKATIVKWSVAGKTLTVTYYYDDAGADSEKKTSYYTLLDDDHLFIGTEYNDSLRLFVRAGKE